MTIDVPVLAHCLRNQPDCPAIAQIHQLQQQLAQLTDLVHTDNLTGLYNQRFLAGALENEIERTHRTGRPTALLILDLDHFKQVNDTYGHDAGNRVLVETARIVKAHIRRIDMACRFGGEEFVVILPNTDLREAVRVAERIRSGIEAAQVEIENGCISVTASLGVDVFREEQNDSVQAFISRADSWLYQSKRQGRNRVSHTPMPASTIVELDEKSALFSLFSESDEMVAGGDRRKKGKGEVD
jgi:diguanylate cyclase (GGDEF)-like protein